MNEIGLAIETLKKSFKRGGILLLDKKENRNKEAANAGDARLDSVFG